MQYIKESIMELKKAIFPDKEEMKKDMVIVMSTLIASSVLLYGIGVAVLALFTKVFA